MEPHPKADESFEEEMLRGYLKVGPVRADLEAVFGDVGPGQDGPRHYAKKAFGPLSHYWHNYAPSQIRRKPARRRPCYRSERAAAAGDRRKVGDSPTVVLLGQSSAHGRRGVLVVFFAGDASAFFGLVVFRSRAALGALKKSGFPSTSSAGKRKDLPRRCGGPTTRRDAFATATPSPGAAPQAKKIHRGGNVNSRQKYKESPHQPGATPSTRDDARGHSDGGRPIHHGGTIRPGASRAPRPPESPPPPRQARRRPGPSIARRLGRVDEVLVERRELRRRRHDLPRRAVPVEVPDLAVAEGADALDGALDLVDERHDADLLRRRRVDVGRAAARPRHPQVAHVLFREGVDLCLLP